MVAVTTLPRSRPLTRDDLAAMPDDGHRDELIDGVVQPDLLVARAGDLTERDLPVAPLLAVEVLSTSTRHFDLMLKRSRFEVAGCPSYWGVDPDLPELIAWELRDGTYVEVGHVRGDEEYAARQPFAVTVRPSALRID